MHYLLKKKDNKKIKMHKFEKKCTNLKKKCTNLKKMHKFEKNAQI